VSADLHKFPGVTLTPDQIDSLVKSFVAGETFGSAVLAAGVVDPFLPDARRSWQYLVDYADKHPCIKIQWEAIAAAKNIPKGQTP